MKPHHKFQVLVKSEVQKLADRILQEKIKGKRDIDRALADLSRKLHVGIKELRKALLAQALKEAKTKYGTVANIRQILGMDKNDLSNVETIEATDLLMLIGRVFSKDRISSKIDRDGNIVKSIINMDKSLDNIPKEVVKRMRSTILAGFIAGDSPQDIAKDLLYKNYDDVAVGWVELIAGYIMHAAQQDTNLELFKRNKKYIGWLKFQTAEDDRVEDVCEICQIETETMKYSPSKYPRYCVPPKHFGCRCALVAGDYKTKPNTDTVKKIVKGKRVNGKCVPPAWLKSGMKYSNIKKIVGVCEFEYVEYFNPPKNTTIS